MRFGSREIADLTFKTTTPNQKIGNKVFAKAGTPCFFIDTARTSSLEQQTSTVYAQGGKGYNRLIAWEGEKTMTFTIEDALISPMGLAVLSGAGLSKASDDNVKHVHCTIDATTVGDSATNPTKGIATISIDEFRDELGLPAESEFYVCKSEAIPAFGTVLDASGSGVDFIETVTLQGKSTTVYDNTLLVNEANPLKLEVDKEYVNKPVKFDLYVVMADGVTEIDIKSQDFGGYYYLEAQTLFRREDTGEDMAAEIIIPKAKVQSGMTISLSASGDPSTFSFTFDAFPAYTRFDKSKKVMCAIQIIGTDTNASSGGDHKHYSWIVEDDFEAGTDVSTSSKTYFLDTDDDKFYKDGTEVTTGVTVATGDPTTAPTAAGLYYVDKTTSAQALYISQKV